MTYVTGKTAPIAWTAEQVTLLTERWNSGWSASDISADFLAIGVVVSRSAVLGKAHRLKLKAKRPHGGARKTQQTEARKVRQRVRNAQKKPPVVKTVVLEALPDPEPEPYVAPPEPVLEGQRRISLIELTEQTCKWPISDPKAADFCFCGAHTEKAPYCEFHSRRAYRSKEGLARL